MTDKEKIYKGIDGERWYQDKKWGTKKNQVASWILFMEHHLNEAKKYISTESDDVKSLHELRKTVALGVACFEEHGLPLRDISEGIKVKKPSKADIKAASKKVADAAQQEIENG